MVCYSLYFNDVSPEFSRFIFKLYLFDANDDLEITSNFIYVNNIPKKMRHNL